MKNNPNPNQTINALKQICGDTDKFDKKIVNKEYLLGKYFQASKTKRINKKQKKYTKSKIQKLLNIQQKIVGKQTTYQFYTPLHRLWQQYMADLLKNESNNQDSVYLKLLRADFHGAYIKIIHSRVNTYIGIEGIIINESLKTYKIINKQNKILTLIKNQMIFQVQIVGKFYAVNANCLVFRSTDRAKHKFKIKNAEKINLQLIGLLLEPDSPDLQQK